jgi:DNA-binding transcriptional regulator YiaG
MKSREKNLLELEHKFRMEEIEAERKAKMEVEKYKLECLKEMQRIKSAEIRKSQWGRQ